MQWMYVLLGLVVGCSQPEPEKAAPASAGPSVEASATPAAAVGGVTNERMITREASVRLRSADPRQVADEATQDGRHFVHSFIHSTGSDLSA